MQLEEIKVAAENAVKAWEEAKGTLATMKKDVDGIKLKTDAFDEAKIKKIADDIGSAAELSQKAQAATETLKKQQEELAAQQKALETAINRPGFGSGDDDEKKAKEVAKKRNKHFNEFARKGSRQQYFDDYLNDAVEDEMERKALSVNSDPAGGFLVMPEFGGVIQGKIFESSPIRRLASVVTIGTDAYEVVTDNDEAAAGWVGETQSRDETATPTLGKISIPVHEMYAEPRATQKILDDAVIDMESWLAQKVSDQFARKEATAFVTGSGVLQPRGIMTYTAGTDINAGQIEQVNSGSATTFTYAGLVNLQSSLKEEYQANATFMVKRASIADLMLILDGNSRPIFNPMFDKNTGLETMLMGRPLRFANDVAAVSGSALAMLYGDIRRAYQIVDRMGVRVLRDAYTAKPYIKFYTTKRVGGGVVNFEAVKIGKISS